MSRDFKLDKTLILVGLGILLAADAGLAAYSWRLSSAPRTTQAELAAERRTVGLQKANISDAEKIKEQMPATQKDCDTFEKSLRPVATGSSALSQELGEIAHKAGLQIEGISFKQKELAEHGLTEVAIDAAVAGPYTSVVKFLNGLQRSNALYAVDALALGGDSQSQGPGNTIKVTLHMKTYFRTAR
jgi:hypothetical protein